MENTSEPFRLDGPSDLADRLIALGTQSLILSEGGLKKLLQLAFQVSFNKEEDIYPRFQIYVPDFEGLPFSLTMRFDSPIPLDGFTLTRLSPGIPPRPYALLVREIDSKLYADGFTKIENFGLEHFELQSLSTCQPKRDSDFLSGIILSIENPGALKVAHFMRESQQITNLMLRVGKIQTIHDFSHTSIAKKVYEGIASTIVDETGSYCAIASLIQWVWSYMVGLALELSHGGAFVILPRNFSLSNQRKLYIKYRTQEPKLGASICKLHSCEDEERRFWSENLFDRARAVAQLSTIDGCVVVDQKFDLVGFGAEIRVKDDSWLPECVNMNPHSLYFKPQELVDLSQFGMRHRSAAWFCAKVPDAVVFVVSQEGEIRQFTHLSDGKVGIWGSLSPLTGSSAPVI